jgi:elongation factor P
VKIGANDIRVGNILEHNKRLWAVLKTMHTQPGKGGAYMQVEMKDIQDGTKNNIRFRSSETVEKVNLEQVHFQYLYDEGDTIAIMDKATFEQRSLPKDLLGDQMAFLQEGMDLAVEMYHERAVAIVLPETVVLEVEHCEPVVKGQTATSSYKPATLVNGIRVTVPQFINQGDKVVVKVATQEYMERAK